MASFFESKAYQTVVSYVYGWGAAIVIVGALFKIMHFPGAGIMLTMGMGIEALIFFVSVFEPPMKHYDWARVFPELAAEEEVPVKGVKKPAKKDPNKIDLGLEDEDINALRASIKQITASAKNFSDLSAGVPDFAANVKNSSSSFATLGEKAKALSDGIETANLKENYSKFTEGLKNSASSFAELNTMLGGLSEVKNFSNSLSTVNEKISSLNALYETQLANSSVVGEQLNKAVSEIATTVDNAKEMTTASKQLATNVSSLNKIYGNMLNAFSNN